MRAAVQEGRVVGGIRLQDRRHALVYRRLMQAQVDVSAHKERLLSEGFDPNLLLPPGEWDDYFH